MSNPQNPARLLATLLSGLSTGTIKVAELQIDPSRPIEDQLAELGDKLAAQHRNKQAAQHRDECPACRAEFEAKQPKAQPASLLVQVGALRQFRHADGGGDSDGFVFGYDTDVADKVVAELQQSRDAAVSQLQSIKDAEANKMAADTKYTTTPGPGSKPVMHLVGYAAFNENDTIIAKSVRATKEEVEMDLAKFKDNPITGIFSSMLGMDMSEGITIRPLFSRRED